VNRSDNGGARVYASIDSAPEREERFFNGKRKKENVALDQIVSSAALFTMSWERLVVPSPNQEGKEANRLHLLSSRGKRERKPAVFLAKS